MEVLVNPLNELYTVLCTPGMAKALEGTSGLAFDKAGMLGQLYQSLSFISKRFITDSKNNFITSHTR